MTTEAPSLTDLLSYDANTPADAPLKIEQVGSETRDGATIQDITFPSVTGGLPTHAYLIRPADGIGSFAGTLYVHWYEPSSPTSNRTQYVDEAVIMARKGVISLLVSTIWSEPKWFNERRSADDFQQTVNQAIELRRALDILLAQPDVDSQRIGYVGHDFGAMFGAMVLAVDARPKAAVLIAGAARFPDWYLFAAADGLPTGDALTAYTRQLAQIDPVNVIKQTQAHTFFQFGEEDFYTPRENFIEFYLAAPAPKRIATYPSEHEMGAAIVQSDRIAWLIDELGL
ncbi:MAG: hypothetical protein H7Y09_01055 [Chitinophagaceae bacterium]|nr:hypothetical protein [Anaerolineae bacterium]